MDENRRKVLDEQLERLERRFAGTGLPRRTILKMFGAVAGTTAMSAVLAACGGDDDDDSAADDTSADVTETETSEETEAASEETQAESTETEASSEETSAESTETEASEDEGTESEGSGAPEPVGELAEEQVFRAPIERDPLHFDYNLDLYCAADASTVGMLGQFDVNYAAVPDIAESWEANEDGSVWTFKIRKDAKWSNGDPLTANDYEWSFKRQLDPATGASYAAFLYDLKNAESFNLGQGATRDEVGVKALDDYTLECTMEQPAAYFPIVTTYFAAAPAHRASVEQYGDKWTDPNEVPEVPCSGPFKLVSWDHDVQFVLEKNENYWNADAITLTRVERPVIANDGWQNAYDNGEIDQILRGQLGQLDRIDGDPELSKQKFVFNLYGTWYLAPDPHKPPFDVKEVRLAMAHAIDREVLCNKVLRGLAKPAYTMYPPGTPDFIEETFPDLTAYDPEKAMQLLEGTPYAGGKNWPKVTLTHREEGDAPKIAADAMIAMFQQNLGMTVEHEVGEPKTTYERMYNHEIQLMWVRWYIDYPDMNNMFFQIWYSKFPSGSRHNWQNDEYDKLVSDARAVQDHDKRIEMYKQAQKIQLEEASGIYVYYVYAYGMNKPYVGNMPMNDDGEPTPGWNVFIRDYDWYQILKV